MATPTTVALDIGDAPVITATFLDAAGAAADPTTITFIVRDPAGTETSYVYPVSGTSKTATGIYKLQMATITAAGNYGVRAKGVGTVICAGEVRLFVTPSLITTP